MLTFTNVRLGITTSHDSTCRSGMLKAAPPPTLSNVSAVAAYFEDQHALLLFIVVAQRTHAFITWFFC